MTSTKDLVVGKYQEYSIMNTQPSSMLDTLMTRTVLTSSFSKIQDIHAFLQTKQLSEIMLQTLLQRSAYIYQME